jgi:type IV secretory pathway ATPase VirB11/archaellum biosynthesis ATPase
MTALERPGASEEGVRPELRSLHQIFPLESDDSRGRLMEETWAVFCRDMTDSVRAALGAGRSPPEIAYAVGETVHNYFRTRGLTLTSLELRRLVVELLAQQEPKERTDELAAMVSFAKPNARPTSWTGDEARPVSARQPDVIPEDAPSALVSRIAPHEAAFDRVLARVLAAAGAPVAAMSRDAALATVVGLVDGVLRDESMDWPAEARERLALVALSEICGLGLIDRLWADRSIDAVFVNGPKAVHVERDGVLARASEVFRDHTHLQELLKRLTHGVSTGIVDVRLRDGGRGTVVFPPVAPAGPVLAIRRGDPGEATFERLIASELIDRRTADLLRIAVRSRLNVLVVGPRGSGKTALLAALARDLAELRVVTVASHRAFRWASSTKVELVGETSALGPLIDAGLRLRPDVLLLDSAPSRAIPTEGRGIVAAADDASGLTADLVVRLSRAPDGLYRVVALEDASGVDILPHRTPPASFIRAVQDAGYGAVLARLLG